MEGSVKMGANYLGKKTGEAVILFQNQDEANRAFNQKQGQNIGPRYEEY